MQYKDILVEYKGGGYDGCFWEWNFFVFDSSGDFHDIFSSGYKGIDNAEQASAFLKEMETDSYVRNRFKPTVYDLNDSEDMESFVDGGNADLMLMAANWLRANLNHILWGSCYECGELFPVVDMFPGNYSGDGGIVYSAKDLYCENCTYNDELNAYNEEMSEYD